MTTKQRRETPKAAAAFARYCAMGSERSLVKLAHKYRHDIANAQLELGKRVPTLASLKRVFERWSSQYHWQERVRTYDQERAEEATRKRDAALEAMYERQARIGLIGQEAGLKEIDRNIEAGTFPAQAAIILLRQGIEIERMARADPLDALEAKKNKRS